MPLAHILAPLIAKKAEQLEADLGHRPEGTAYLNSGPGPHVGDPTSSVLHGQVAVREPAADPAAARAQNQARVTGYLNRSLDARAPGVGTAVGAVASRGPQAMIAQTNIDSPLVAGRQALAMEKVVAGAADTKAAKALAKQKDADRTVHSYATPFINGVIKGQAMQAKREQHLMPIPLANAAPAPAGEPVAYTESGAPIYEDRTPPPMPLAGPRHNQIIITPEDMGQITDEAGRAVDRRGRPTGYLAQPDQRGLQRAPVYRPSDIVLDAKRGGFLTQPHDFEIQSMRQMYGQHLKAMQDNRDGEGGATDKFPEGYFGGMSKAQRKNIEMGTKALMQLEKDLEAGGGQLVTRT